MIFDSIRDSVNETTTHGERVKAYYDKHRPAIVEVSRALTKIEDKVIRVQACANEIDLNLTGDKHVLKAIFGAFRKLGYEPNHRPGKEPEPGFSCRFYHTDHQCQFWLNFTSTQCTRVKVGEKTQTIDIYETVCE